MIDISCFVYLMYVTDDSCGFDLIKVGISQFPEKRLAGVQTSSPYPIGLLKTRRLPTRKWAYDVEHYFHSKNHLCRLRGEWFIMYPPGACVEIESVIIDVWESRGGIKNCRLRELLRYCELDDGHINNILQSHGFSFDLISEERV